MDAGSEAMHTRMYAGFGGGRIENLIRALRTSCFVQGADMHKYNTLYTHRLAGHVL